jgi:Animal haem peroxidase
MSLRILHNFHFRFLQTSFISNIEQNNYNKQNPKQVSNFNGHEMVPLQSSLMIDNANANTLISESELFFAGDVRANKQIGLTVFHTLFVREHNRLCDELITQFGGGAGLGDQHIYGTYR